MSFIHMHKNNKGHVLWKHIKYLKINKNPLHLAQVETH